MASQSIYLGKCINYLRVSGEDEVARGMLIYCNTPRYNGVSPAQLLFGHPVRNLLPAHRRAFEPSWQKCADDLDKQTVLIKEQVRERYDLSAKDLPHLFCG